MPKVAELGETQGTSITFSKAQYDELKRVADENKRTIAFLVRVAVAEKYPVPADEQGAA